jgi:hypothetical protein
MDKTQLITIAISALFGAVTKSLVDWIASIIKTTKTASAVTARIKIVFSKANRAIMFDTFLLIFYVGVLIYFSSGETPITRLEVLLMIGAVLAIIFIFLSLTWKIYIAVNERKNKP